MILSKKVRRKDTGLDNYIYFVISSGLSNDDYSYFDPDFENSLSSSSDEQIEIEVSRYNSILKRELIQSSDMTSFSFIESII